MVFRHGCYLLFFLVATFTCLNASVIQDIEQAGKSPSRVKRNIIQFGNMIRCATGRSAWDYNNYGCHCGKGGSGRTVDGVDECCRQHDTCYDRITRNKLCSFIFYFGYDVYLEWYNRVGCTGCASWDDACERAICECDGTAARCFARNTYNPFHKNYPKSLC